jgi:hypothetical protein
MMVQDRDFFYLLTETLQHLKIDPKKCLSDSTDGAASYHGHYNGLQSKITDGLINMFIYDAMPMS